MEQEAVINRYKIRISLSFLVSSILAITTWAIFYPGTLSADSLYTYREAAVGQFSDVRPPLVTFALHLFLKMEGGLGLFTLLESLSGFYGLRRLLLAIPGVFHIHGSKREWIACAGLLLLSSPLTPMPVYFVTLWVDSWLAIFLLWTVALMLELAIPPNEDKTVNWFKIFITLFLIVLVILVRWNSIFLYPILVFILSVLLFEKGISTKMIFALAASPLVLYFLFLTFQYEVVKVKRIHTERFAYALDLASVITYDSRVCQSLALQSCQMIKGKITSQFMVGNGAIDHTMNQGMGSVEPAFAELRLHPLLPQELWMAASHYPLSFIQVKVLNFLDYLRPTPRYYFQSFIRRNGMGIYINERFMNLRIEYISWLHWVYSHPILKMFSFAHITWIGVNLAGIVFCFVFNRGYRLSKILGLILLVPIFYDLTYLIALTSSDFRYMYPATLIVEVLAIGIVAVRLGYLSR